MCDYANVRLCDLQRLQLRVSELCLPVLTVTPNSSSAGRLSTTLSRAKGTEKASQNTQNLYSNRFFFLQHGGAHNHGQGGQEGRAERQQMAGTVALDRDALRKDVAANRHAGALRGLGVAGGNEVVVARLVHPDGHVEPEQVLCERSR